jgi:hypothetical protein
MRRKILTERTTPVEVLSNTRLTLPERTSPRKVACSHRIAQYSVFQTAADEDEETSRSSASETDGPFNCIDRL